MQSFVMFDDNLEFFHLPGFFTQTLSVASVTDMRYVVMVVFVRERREVLNVLC